MEDSYCLICVSALNSIKDKQKCDLRILENILFNESVAAEENFSSDLNSIFNCSNCSALLTQGQLLLIQIQSLKNDLYQISLNIKDKIQNSPKNLESNEPSFKEVRTFLLNCLANSKVKDEKLEDDLLLQNCLFKVEAQISDDESVNIDNFEDNNNDDVDSITDDDETIYTERKISSPSFLDIKEQQEQEQNLPSNSKGKRRSRLLVERPKRKRKVEDTNESSNSCDDSLDDDDNDSGDEDEDKPRKRAKKLKIQIGSDLKCPDCGKQYNQRRSLRLHIQYHHLKDSIKCMHCGSGFQNHKQRKKHIIKVHQEHLNFQCKTCNLKFISEIALKNHEDTHKDTDYECSECKKIFNSRSKLNVHMKRHTAKVLCSICGKCYSRKVLQDHMRRVHSTTLFSCDLCNFVTKAGSYLRNHKQEAHSEENNKICHVCGRTFKRTTLLKDHMRSHTGEKPYICDFVGENGQKCSKAFRTSYYLQNHKTSHRPERPFICEIDGKGFATNNLLKLHYRTHLGLANKSKSKKCTEFSLPPPS